MRRVEKWEEKRDVSEVMLDTLGQATTIVSRPKFYSKFRAYLFMNFEVITVAALMMAVMYAMSDESDTLAAAGGCLLVAAGSAFICMRLWKTVSKKVKPEERRLVFLGFEMTAILVFVKVLLCFTLILIPFVMHIGEENPYVYRYINEGEHAGSTVLMRHKWNGQYEDIYGNIYED